MSGRIVARSPWPCARRLRPRPAACGAPAKSSLSSVVVQPERTPIERRLDGVIEAVNQGTVAAQTTGRVGPFFTTSTTSCPPAPSSSVCARPSSTPDWLQAQAALSEATAREAEAQTRYQRIADLYQRKVVPKATLDQATANRDAAAARLSAARAGLESAKEGVAYTEIRAPYAGVVTKRLVQVGETVSPGTPLMSGLSLQYLRVTVDVPQSIVDQVRRLKQAAVYVGERRIEATKVTIFPEASTPSSTFRARLELPENATDLYPGMFVKVGFVIGEADRLLVPAQRVRRAQRSDGGLCHRLKGPGLDAAGAARGSLRRPHRDPLGS